MKKIKRSSETEFGTNRILLVLVIALLAVLSLLLLDKLIAEAGTAIITIFALQILGALSVLGVGFGIYRFIVEKKKKLDVSHRWIRGSTLIIFFGILSFCSFLIVSINPITAIRILYVCVPGFAILYLIFMIFSRDFFIISVLCLFSALLFWCNWKLLENGQTNLAILLSAIAGLMIILLIFALQQAKKCDGKLKLGSLQIHVTLDRSGYSLVFFTMALIALLVLLTFLFSPQLIQYFGFGLLGYLFLLAVYYTVKLI